MYERNSKTTRYTKGVRITEEDYDFINAVKSKKSAAGKLEEIIKLYKNANVRLRQVRRK
jgi:hypothetical protein